MDEKNEWVGRRVRISLKSGMYYKGLVLSAGEEFIKIRDFKDNIVFIRWEFITIIEGWNG